MSQLKTFLAIGIAVLGATAGSAQAAGSHKHITLFDLFQNPAQEGFLKYGVRISNDLSGDKVPEKPSGEQGNWTYQQADNGWQSNSASQNDTDWTTQQVSQPPQSPWTPHYATP